MEATSSDVAECSRETEDETDGNICGRRLGWIPFTILAGVVVKLRDDLRIQLAVMRYMKAQTRNDDDESGVMTRSGLLRSRSWWEED